MSDEQSIREADYALLLELKRSYQLAFKSPAGEAVMKDLSKYCFARATTGGDLLLEGRRQVFLRIERHLEMDVPQLYARYQELGGLFNG